MTKELPIESYKQLILQSVDILTVLDESGQIKYESPSITHVLGYTPEELVGETVFDYIHPDDQQKAMETFYEMADKEGYTTTAVDIRFRHKNGSWIWIETRGSNQMATDLDGYLVSSRNISDRKESEQQLQRERDRLDRFASVISHDLRNPLNVIGGRLELVQEECESEHLNDIEEAVDRIDEMIEDLLVIAREGNKDLEEDTVDLQNVVENCQNHIDTKTATFNVQTTQTILADERQLKNVLENLFRNAIEHGGEDVTITVGSLDNGFYVEDDGEGIPEDIQDSVLEYGFSSKTNGTGFGLNIVDEIINNHSWDLDIEEGSEGGARFVITGVQIE